MTQAGGIRTIVRVKGCSTRLSGSISTPRSQRIGAFASFAGQTTTGVLARSEADRCARSRISLIFLGPRGVALRHPIAGPGIANTCGRLRLTGVGLQNSRETQAEFRHVHLAGNGQKQFEA